VSSVADSKIGEILLSQGAVTSEALEDALARQQGPDKGKRLGDILVNMEAISQEQLLTAFSRQLNMPYLSVLSEEKVDKDLVARVPLNFLLAHQVIPLKEEDGVVTVAISDPLDTQPLDDLRLLLDRDVRAVIAAADEIVRIANRCYGHANGAAEKMLEDLEEGEETAAHEVINVSQEAEDLLDIASKAPVIRLVNLIIFEAVKARASDIHIEPFEKELRVRYRIDGVLYDAITPPKQHQAAITSRIKIMANLNIAEKRLPQDGRIKIKITDREIDIRVSVIPVSFGERIVLRLLDRSSRLYSLHDLGLAEDRLKLFRKLLDLSHGIILVTGPTGSGKTTTLYAALSEMNSTETNIITIEDPVEYQLPGIGQIQVNPKIELTFANGLRSILRQDPDVVLIGEMRDLVTAEIAIQASLTGHLVFSTLHTNDAAGAVTRLLDMGVEPYLVSSSVVAIMAQRLVRQICPHCREAYRPQEESLKEIGLTLADVKGGVLYKGKGCAKCFKTAYLGRSAIFEILLIDDEIRRMVLEHTATGTIKKHALEKGMLTLRMDGALKVINGETTIDEVLRVTQTDIIEA
jgi:general secretion pathway protein E